MYILNKWLESVSRNLSTQSLILHCPMTVKETFKTVTKISIEGKTDTRIYSTVSVSHNFGYKAVI